MALSTPTLLDTTTQGAGSSITSSTVSPSANALVIAVAAFAGGQQRTLSSVSSTFSTQTGWTTQENVSMNSMGGGDNGSFIAAYAQTGSSPGSGTVTVELSGNQGRSTLYVLELTGHDTTTPIPQSANGVGSGTTVSATLGSTPATDSTVLGAFVGQDSDGVTPDAGFTELADTLNASGYDFRTALEYDADSPPAEAGWSDFDGSGNAYALALEVTASSGGAVSVSTSEGAESGETFAAAMALTASMTEGAASGDSLSPIASLTSAIQEGAEAGETWATDLIAAASISEGAESGESFAATLSGALLGATSEGSEAGDTFAATLTTIAASISEGSESGDSFSASVLGSIIAGQITEGAEPGDTFAATSTLTAALAEGALAGDTWTASATLQAAITEGAEAGDQISTPDIATFLTGTVRVAARLAGKAISKARLGGSVTLND